NRLEADGTTTQQCATATENLAEIVAGAHRKYAFIRSAAKLLSQHGMTDRLLAFNGACEPSRFDRFGTPSAIKIEHYHGIFIADFELLSFVLHVAATHMSIDVNGHFTSSHITPNAVNSHTISAIEAFRTYIRFIPAFTRRAFQRIDVAQVDSATGSARLRRRANGAWRLLDR